jgi:hypothetical protein
LGSPAILVSKHERDRTRDDRWISSRRFLEILGVVCTVLNASSETVFVMLDSSPEPIARTGADGLVRMNEAVDERVAVVQRDRGR